MTNRLIDKKVSLDRHIAWLTLNRPQKKNAMSEAMMDMLIADLNEISENRDIHVIVLSGAGNTFCSGLDLYDLRAEQKRPKRWGRAASTPEIARLLRLAPQVTIASVEGYALGGGLVLVHACDLAVAADTAKLGMPEILRGTYGAVATPTLFQTRIPNKVAFDIQLTGRNLSGTEAAQWGLVSRCVPAAELSQTVDSLAREIAQRHPVALAHAKIAAYSALDLPWQLAMQADDTVYHRMRSYMDPVSDIENYLESQKGGGNVSYKRPDVT